MLYILTCGETHGDAYISYTLDCRNDRDLVSIYVHDIQHAFFVAHLSWSHLKVWKVKSGRVVSITPEHLCSSSVHTSEFVFDLSKETQFISLDKETPSIVTLQ